MIYEYRCDQCKTKFDVIKRVSDYDRPENCKCGYEATRTPFPRKLFLSQTAVQDRYFNHALGTVCTDTEAKQIAKQRGMIEVGNEDVTKHAQRVEAEKSQELERAYDDVWKGA